MYYFLKPWILNCLFYLELLTLFSQRKGVVTLLPYGVEIQVVPSGVGSPHSPHGLHRHCRVGPCHLLGLLWYHPSGEVRVTYVSKPKVENPPPQSAFAARGSSEALIFSVLFEESKALVIWEFLVSLGCPYCWLWMERSGFCACGISRLLALQLHVWEIRGREKSQRT